MQKEDASWHPLFVSPGVHCKMAPTSTRPTFTVAYKSNKPNAVITVWAQLQFE